MSDWQSTKNQHDGLDALWGHRAKGSPQHQPQLPQTCLQENKPAEAQENHSEKHQSKNAAFLVAINILHLWLFMHLFVHLHLKQLGTSP